MVDDDAEEVRQILSVVSTEVPKLLSALSESLFGGEATRRYAEAVSEFYKRLREAGMDEKLAFELTKEFMDKTNLGGLIQGVMGGSQTRSGKGAMGGDLETTIRDRVRQKLKEAGLEGESE